MDHQTFKVNHNNNLISEHNEETELKTECEFDLGPKEFNLDQIVDFAVNWASIPIPLNPEPTNLSPPSIEPSPPLELKVLPSISNTST